MTSPRERFRNNADLSKGWNDFVTSAQFIAATDAAMLTFQDDVKMASDMATSAANEWKRQGAKEFLRALINLNNSPQPAVPVSGTDKELEYKR